MSTAIVYCGLSDGFVIGSDSLVLNYQTGAIQTDKERKIFAFENPSISGIFAWSGTTIAIGSGGRGVLISLIRETYKILAVINFQDFANDFNARLNDRISILEVNRTRDIARGIFLYYWMGIQIECRITIFANGRTWESKIDFFGPPTGKVVIMSGGDPDEFDDPHSLGFGKNIIEAYIQASIDDPKYKCIGGKPQIGKLTTEGFSWLTVDPYLSFTTEI
jgi:hypothetical protein